MPKTTNAPAGSDWVECPACDGTGDRTQTYNRFTIDYADDCYTCRGRRRVSPATAARILLAEGEA